jgi:hypothetical protein
MFGYNNVPKLEVLATLQGELLLLLASSALKTQDDLLGSLGLLVEDGLGLTTITALLPVVTTLTLGVQGGLWTSIRISICRDGSNQDVRVCSPCQPCTG